MLSPQKKQSQSLGVYNDNTDKLLRAFIEASGYEIEEVESSSSFYGAGCINEDGTLKEGALPLGTVKSIDYKVSKAKGVIESNAYQFILDAQGPEFSCIAKYIDDHKDEIELKVMDYGDLQPMLDYFCRNS